jgi:long-subunit acyl-CoA synthetase (AMP-forming)
MTTTSHASVGVQFLAQCARSGAREAFRTPSGEDWIPYTWAETETRARELAAGLLALGVQPEQRVAIAATTRVEWILADLAIALAGAATTTVYPSTNAEDVDYIFNDCAAVVAFAEDETQLAKLRNGTGFVGEIRHVVLFDGDATGEDVMSLDALADLGRYQLSEHPTAVDDAVAAVTPDHLATIIYTSGTTGRPKGVELTHANWIYLGQAVASEGVVRPDHLQFLWLPLSHVFGKLLLAAQYEIGFVTVIDGRIDRIVDNVAVIKPSFMAAAPRIFEKIYSRVVSTTKAQGGVTKKIFDRAFAVGIDAVRRRQRGKRIRLGSAPNSPSPTDWCSPRSGAAWVTTSNTWSRAVPRWLHRSPSGSPPSACPSSRATGCRRPRVQRSSTAPARCASARSARHCRARTCASPRTERSCCAVLASCAATTTCPNRPPRSLTKTVGSPLATSVNSTRLAS